MLDHFIYGQVNRVSPEAPIPVLQVRSEQSMLGGLGNVVRNLGALGCATHVFSVTGDDAPGQKVARLRQAVPRCKSLLLQEAGRSTTVKVRYVADTQQLLRADKESTHKVGAATLQNLLQKFEEAISACTVVVLSDYAKGMLTGVFPEHVIRIATSLGKPVIVDPKGRDFARYRRATLIKPNLKELADASQMPVADTEQQVAAAQKLMDQTEVEHLLLTRGADGMLLLSSGGEVRAYSALAREVFEVSGAGDTVASGLAASLGSGCSIADAAAIANIAAGIVVGKVGTATVDRSEIVHEIEHESVLVASDKILRADQIVDRVRLWKRNHLRVGFMSGTFDHLSPANLELMEKARNSCDRLVIAVQPEPSATQDQRTRAYVLASLVFTDAVVLSGQTSSESLLTALQPDLVFPS